MRILTVFGTRPEAIKLVPLLRAMREDDRFSSIVCVTGQHRQMLDQVMRMADITPDIDMNIMTPGQTLTDITNRILKQLPEVIATTKPDRILVQGDTTTAFAAALAGFYAKLPVAHVEAGLRSHDTLSPWPEEVNRRMVSIVTDVHFAPTPMARANLMAEAIQPEHILVTGNTVIDALQYFHGQIKKSRTLREKFEQLFPFIEPYKKLVLVTSHRRENFEQGIRGVCQALLMLARRSDVQIIFPVHPNPNVREPVHAMLKNIPNIFLIEPQDYLPFVYLMGQSYLILSDSGGIQEEAPALGKPVLVLRDNTERPEAISAGTAMLVGTDPDKITTEANLLLDNITLYRKMARARNPFGDGKATPRIMEKLWQLHSRKSA